MQFTLLKPMLPSLVHQIPTGEHWFYEVKYDGYRTIVHWDDEAVFLQSRNLNSLGEQFPEVVEGLLQKRDSLRDMFPLVMDAELCVLTSDFKGDFGIIQQRGRLRESSKIKSAAVKNPAQLCVFDLLVVKGINISSLPYHERKKQLRNLLESAMIPTDVRVNSILPILGVASKENPDELWNIVKLEDSEGIIAKKTNSIWQSGRTKDWVKIKNNKHGLFIITGFDPANGFFHVGVVKDDNITPIGLFSHGLEGDQRDAIIQIIHKNQIDVVSGIVLVEPRICVELEFLELYKEQLRQPRFVRFRFDQTWEVCTWEALQTNKEI
jgi:bifunctional non-homologous end joining protein LigD